MESVEFFQFHGIRPWNSFSSTESMEIGGIWRHISTECRGIFTSLPAPLYCRHFSWKPRHLLKNSVRILHGSIPRNSTMIPWHIYRRVTVPPLSNNCLNPDQAQQCVRPDLRPNCLLNICLSADNISG